MTRVVSLIRLNKLVTSATNPGRKKINLKKCISEYLLNNKFVKATKKIKPKSKHPIQKLKKKKKKRMEAIKIKYNKNYSYFLLNKKTPKNKLKRKHHKSLGMFPRFNQENYSNSHFNNFIDFTNKYQSSNKENKKFSQPITSQNNFVNRLKFHSKSQIVNKPQTPPMYKLKKKDRMDKRRIKTRTNNHHRSLFREKRTNYEQLLCFKE